MPIYQYKCSECDHQMEALQKMSDPKLTDCPECSKPALRKQLTAAAFKLKGTGWYETDFKNSGAKPKATESKSGNSKTKDAKADKPGSEKKSTPKSDSSSMSKPAAKSA